MILFQQTKVCHITSYIGIADDILSGAVSQVDSGDKNDFKKSWMETLRRNHLRLGERARKRK